MLEPFDWQNISLAVDSSSNFKVPLKGNKMPLRLNFKFEIIEPDPKEPSENEFLNIFEYFYSTNNLEPSREHHQGQGTSSA